MRAASLLHRAAFALAALAAAGAAHAVSGTLAISAVVLSKNSCTFRGATPALEFVIDAAASTAKTATISWTLRCMGSSAVASWAMSADGGMHADIGGMRQMEHATDTSEHLAYTLSVPASGIANKGEDTAFTISGSIDPAAFQNALPGTYSDTVTITLTP